MIVYLYSKCSTCKKAKQFLAANNIPVIIKEITETPPSENELKKMLNFQKGNITKLLNTSGQLYRDMQLSKKVKEMLLSETLSLLTQHGMLVKRPFLIGNEVGLVGFKENEWSSSLLRNQELKG